jgi:hypothetical protein
MKIIASISMPTKIKVSQAHLILRKSFIVESDFIPCIIIVDLLYIFPLVIAKGQLFFTKPQYRTQKWGT